MKNIQRMPSNAKWKSSLLDLLDEPEEQSVRLSGHMVMTPAQWHLIEDNPRQRDTERHAKRARHLLIPHPKHRIVSMAIVDGRHIKLDGHSRDFLWTKGVVPAPSSVLVEEWLCETIEDAMELYSTFDSVEAVETVGDKMAGATRQHDAKFESPLLHRGGFATAMRVPYEAMFSSAIGRAKSVYDLMGYWMPELKILDTCRPTPHRFPTGITAGALITFRRYGPVIKDFWERYANNKGTQIEGEWDAVQALDKKVAKRRLDNALNGASNILTMMGVSINAVEGHRIDYIYKQGVKEKGDTAMPAFCKRAKTTARNWE